jgi:hypothetical protein
MPAKSFHSNFRIYRIGLPVFTLLVGAILLLPRAPGLRQQDRQSTSPERALPFTEVLPIRAALNRSVPPNYRYSVIPHGVYSVGELEAALATDPIVKAHYSAFDRTKLRMVQAQSAKLMYTSYRKGDLIYWTNHRVRVAADEMLVTDGSNLARARCGNRLSEAPQHPVAQVEPPPSDFDGWEAPPEATVVLSEGGSSSPSALIYDLFPSTVGLISGAPLVETQGGGVSSASGAANYTGYAMPGDASAVPMSSIGTAASTVSATNWQISTATGGPFVVAIPVPINTLLTPQTLQVWNPGNAYSPEPSYGAFGFRIGDAAAWPQLATGNTGPLSSSLMAQVSSNRPTAPSAELENENLARSEPGTSALLAISNSRGAVGDVLVVKAPGSVPSAPEAATAPLLGIGLLGMAWMLRRLARSSKPYCPPPVGGAAGGASDK